MVERIEDALARVDAILTRATYDEVVAALDECARHPDAASVLPGIWQRRIAALGIYERPDDERARALDEYLERNEPLLWRALAVFGTCADRPELMRQYMFPILAEVEAAAAAGDHTFIRALADMRLVRDRTLGAPHSPL